MDGPGLLGKYNVRRWFDSLTEDQQLRIFKYYKNDTTDIRNLVEGEWLISSQSAVKFLSFLALNALAYHDHEMCDMLLNRAGLSEKIGDDLEFYRSICMRVREEKAYIFNKDDIDRYKIEVLSVIEKEPGIVQSELKKRFGPEKSELVGYAISKINQDGKIRREKSGRSFKLYMSQ